VQTLAALFRQPLLASLVVGSIVLISINALIFGFVVWLTTFFVKQDLNVTLSFAYTLAIVLGAPIGCAIGAFACDAIGGRRTIIAASVATIVLGSLYPFVADPSLVLAVGFCLIVAIYVPVAVRFGVYTPELFPTELRLRGNGICNALGRAATMVSPFVVVALFSRYGVLALMVGLMLVQIVAVAGWRVEPAGRRLAEVPARSEPLTRRPSADATDPVAPITCGAAATESNL
jgi:putative MFS transporter